jgi:uncharacterized protein (TIGR02444 family)
MADGFWDFSLRFYNDGDVQQACLAFQDDHGGDVNVMLYLLYRAGQGAAYRSDGVRALDAAIAPWREEMVRPIRTLRRTLKTKAYLPDAEAQDSFRNQVKKIELNAEKLQQAVLEGNAPAADETDLDPRDAASQSLAAYAAVLGTKLPETLTARFVDRLAAVA